jgi:chromate transporter
MTNQNEFESKNPRSIAVQDFFTINRLFLAWLRIGFTSFGGGAITQYLIQESFIYKHKWITAKEYANIIAMCQITPGINIIAYTILIGKRLAGWPGIFVSVMGLILPSALITIGISAIYTRISEFSKVQAALRSVFAAIFGIALATNWRNVRPILVSNYKRGSGIFSVTIGIIIGSAMIYVLLNPPVVILYLLGGLCGALTYWYVAKTEREDE